ncbi:MAG: oligoendopeptidase F [Anaerolineaceae bacterium]|jgi:oligoendopeptidase F|nr:MAG: oligoendopeptidase F [Anaerolineaceae bacterium]
MPGTVSPRNKIEKKYTWNAESVFPSDEAWEKEVEKIFTDVSLVKRFQGKLGESATALLEGFKSYEALMIRAQTAYMYASFSYSVDTTNQKAAGMRARAAGMYGQVMSAVSFIQPELLEIGQAKLDEFLEQEEKLRDYKFFLENLFRRQAHVRSAEVEEVLGLASEPFNGFYNSTSMLTNADFKFKPVKDVKGRTLDVTQGSFEADLMFHADRKVRKNAYISYMDKYMEHKNTLASNLAHNIQVSVFNMRVRKHESTLAASLFDLNIHTNVFHNLINTFKKNLPVWHRYFDIRRRALGLKKFAYYDMWAPIEKKKAKVPFEQAVDLICESLAPLGSEYVETIRRGSLKDRWVDVYPNQGKTHGAFSSGAYGTHPFIMMSYANNAGSMSTLAHELGHSMHTHLTNKNQAFINSDYSLFVAEVASNFHQAMMRGHLLDSVKDKNFQLALILEAVGGNMFRYFFQMPTLARFELETHQRAERGEPLTADSMIDLMADLFAEGFGPHFDMDRERVGMTWSTFPHLFADYYVYAYATGISGAHALAGRILRGEPNAVEDYLGFLKSGNSDYSLNVLKKAGVDLTTPKPVEETFAVMERYIDRLEELVG